MGHSPYQRKLAEYPPLLRRITRTPRTGSFAPLPLWSAQPEGGDPINCPVVGSPACPGSPGEAGTGEREAGHLCPVVDAYLSALSGSACDRRLGQWGNAFAYSGGWEQD